MAKRTTIRLIPTLQADLTKLANDMGVSYNQLVNYALTRFVEAQKGLSVLEDRAQRGSRSAFRRALRKVDQKRLRPEPQDTLPPGYTRQAAITKLKNMAQEEDLPHPQADS